jgi:hypothetical protein
VSLGVVLPGGVAQHIGVPPPQVYKEITSRLKEFQTKNKAVKFASEWSALWM